MGSRWVSNGHRRPVALAAVVACIAGAAALMPVSALGQEPTRLAATEQPGIFQTIGRWFDQQTNHIGSTLGGARQKVEEIGQQAEVATTTTVDHAKNAAGAVVRLPATRVVSGNVQCHVAPNGAPDCVTAAEAVCRDNGFKSGSSIGTTAAVVCPPEALLAGHLSGPGCHTETFVSRALCQ